MTGLLETREYLKSFYAKNEIYVNCFNHIPRITIIELFENPSCWNELGLTDGEIEIFKKEDENLQEQI